MSRFFVGFNNVDGHGNYKCNRVVESSMNYLQQLDTAGNSHVFLVGPYDD